jgi:purine nucleosidase
LIKAPQIIPKIQDVVIMGGAITQGNVTPSAEFNLYVDPHAAHIVFTSGLKLTLITLDITHQVLTTPERLEKIRAIGTPVSQAAVALLSGYGSSELEKYGIAGSPLHDPCVIAYLLQPELFTGREQYVEVEILSELTMGRTVIDLYGATENQPNINVIQTVNADGFYHLLSDRLAHL